MLKISNRIHIHLDEIDFQPIRAQGAGGQNVNKVSSAVHLRFNIHTSALPEEYKHKLLAWSDQRISGEGVIVIKAQTYRTREKNRADALERLRELVLQATTTQKKRKPTKPSRSSQRKRLDGKKKRSHLKSGRGRVDY